MVIKVSKRVKSTQKSYNLGDWTVCLLVVDSGDANGYPDLGHYAGNTAWNNGTPDTPMGVYMQKDLDAGTYVFGIESKAALREPKKNDWNNDDGLKPAYGVAYIVKIVEGADPDTIVLL